LRRGLKLCTLASGQGLCTCHSCSCRLALPRTKALELRIAGKAVWFEPIEDDDDEEAGPRIMVSFISCISAKLANCQEGTTERRGTLKGNEAIPTFSEGYGSTGEAGGLASQSSKGPQSP
jgi:hypothetical protein